MRLQGIFEYRAANLNLANEYPPELAHSVLLVHSQALRLGI